MLAERRRVKLLQKTAAPVTWREPVGEDFIASRAKGLTDGQRVEVGGQ